MGAQVLLFIQDYHINIWLRENVAQLEVSAAGFQVSEEAVIGYIRLHVVFTGASRCVICFRG